MENPKKIFIAEDDFFIAADLKEMLTEMGYRVTGIGTDAPSSIALLRDTPPDIAVLDIRLRGKNDGLRIAEYINLHLKIPFVFVTAYSDGEMVEQATRHSPAAYLVKPFSRNAIFSTLETVKALFGLEE